MERKTLSAWCRQTLLLRSRTDLVGISTESAGLSLRALFFAAAFTVAVDVLGADLVAAKRGNGR